MNYFISRYSQKVQKTSILTHFSPICGLVDPLYGAKHELFCFIWFRLHYIVMTNISNHSQWTISLHYIAKNFRKPQFWRIFTHFCPICQIWIVLFYLFRLRYIVIGHNELFYCIYYQKVKKNLNFDPFWSNLWSLGGLPTFFSQICFSAMFWKE